MTGLHFYYFTRSTFQVKILTQSIFSNQSISTLSTFSQHIFSNVKSKYSHTGNLHFDHTSFHPVHFKSEKLTGPQFYNTFFNRSTFLSQNVHTVHIFKSKYIYLVHIFTTHYSSIPLFQPKIYLSGPHFHHISFA